MGHVFVARGDLRRFVCHAALLPGTDDAGPGITEGWLDDARIAAAFDQRGRLLEPRPVGGSGRLWLTEATLANGASVHLLNSGAGPTTPDAWYLDGMRAYVEALVTHPPTAASPDRESAGRRAARRDRRGRSS